MEATNVHTVWSCVFVSCAPLHEWGEWDCWLMWNRQVSCSCRRFDILLSPARSRGMWIFLTICYQMTASFKKLWMKSQISREQTLDVSTKTSSLGLGAILMSSIVTGLLFHTGRGSVSHMLSTHVSVPLDVFVTATGRPPTSQDVFLWL